MMIKCTILKKMYGGLSVVKELGGSDQKRSSSSLTPLHSFNTQAVAPTLRRWGVGVELPHIISAFLCKTITSGKLSNNPNRVCIQGIGERQELDTDNDLGILNSTPSCSPLKSTSYEHQSGNRLVRLRYLYLLIVHDAYHHIRLEQYSIL